MGSYHRRASCITMAVSVLGKRQRGAIELQGNSISSSLTLSVLLTAIPKNYQSEPPAAKGKHDRLKSVRMTRMHLCHLLASSDRGRETELAPSRRMMPRSRVPSAVYAPNIVFVTMSMLSLQRRSILFSGLPSRSMVGLLLHSFC